MHEATAALDGIDLLINNAGVSEFTEFARQSAQAQERIVNLNLIAPMHLARLVLPDMLEQGSGRIVNVGSVFGSIGFAYFSAYSASKFGLRGFSQALRRELEGTGIGVTYVAPRAVRTRLNSEAVYRMAAAVKMHMDEPARVAAGILRAVDRQQAEAYLGFPESLFVRLNALFPRLVDGALRKQNRRMHGYARPPAPREEMG